MMRLFLALGSFVLLALSLPLSAGPTARSEGSWERLGFAGAKVQSIALDASRPNTLLVVTRTGAGFTGFDFKVYRSGDRGLTWNELADLSGVVQSIPGGVSAGRGVYYAAGSGIYRSADGLAWTRVYTPTEASELVLALRVSRSNPQVAYALIARGSLPGALLRTGDGGDTWLTRNGPGAYAVLYDVDVDSQLVDRVYVAGSYAGTYPAKWVSDDGGLQWEGDGIGAGPGEAAMVRADATLSGTYYVAAELCLYRISKGMQTPVSPSVDCRFTFDLRGRHGLAPSGAVPGGLFAYQGLGGDTVEWSVDRGDHWASLGAPAGYIGTLEVDDENPLSLYLGTTDGLWRTRLPRYYFPNVMRDWPGGW